MSFVQLSDRTVVSAIKHTEWSPNKDLLACITQDCQLHAYRAFPSFQRMWSLSFESEPTTLCWHPDGVRLALGHSDGSVSVIEAEDGRAQMQVRKAFWLALRR
jgi:WD40 repeat protein